MYRNAKPNTSTDKRKVDVFFTKRDWPTACAVAIALLLLLVIPIVLLQRAQNAEARGAHR